MTERADVVLPVAASDEKAGSYLNWEGRTRPFDVTLEGTGALPDCRVLDTLAVEMDADLFTQTPAAARGDFEKLGPASALRWGHVDAGTGGATAAPGAGQAVLSTWRQLIDNGSLQDGEPHLKGTQRTPVARLSAKTAEGLGDHREGEHRTRRDHAAGGDRGPARRRRVAAGQLRRLRRVQDARRRARRRREPRWRWAMIPLLTQATDAAVGSVPDAATRAALLADDPFWLILLKCVVILLIGPIMTIFLIVWERKAVGRMQNRPGPNRVGPGGYLQSLADAIKLPFKEQIIPDTADRKVYFLAPVMCVVPSLIALSAIPFGPVVSIFGEQTVLQLLDLPVSALVILACSSIGVYGIVLAGWSSGSPYPLLGGMRSAAQVISYEIAMGLSIVAVILQAGSLNLADIVGAQHKAGGSSC